MVKRIKSLAQIRKQIGVKKAKIAKAKTRADLEMERREAERELKVLSRSTSTKRNIVLARRTGRGFKRLTKAGLKLGAKQFKLIRDQQLRDEAMEKRMAKRRSKVRKSIKKTRGKVNKIRSKLPGQIIADLDF